MWQICNSWMETKAIIFCHKWGRFHSNFNQVLISVVIMWYLISNGNRALKQGCFMCRVQSHFMSGKWLKTLKCTLADSWTSKVFNESKLFLFACNWKESELIWKVDSWLANEKASTAGICSWSAEMATGVGLYRQWLISASHLCIPRDYPL